MEKSAPLTPRYLRIATEILEWAEEFLVPTNPELRRPVGGKDRKEAGAVCPFVEPSIRNDHFQMAFHPEINGKSEEDIEELLYRYIPLFKRLPPYDPSGQRQKALLVVFTDIPERGQPVLSQAAGLAKDKFVDDGLMLAPFYPSCADTSVHNPALQTSRAPYAFIAIRHMARHDIYFLHQKKEWFDAYNRSFGHHFDKPETLDDYEKPLVKLYEEAKNNFRV